MRVLCALGKHQYGDPGKGIGIEYAAFLPALRALGWEVLHFESCNPREFGDLVNLNRSLIKTVETFRPQVFLAVQRHYELWTETLAAIRARGDVATICWTTDDSWKYRECSRFIGKYYHAITTTYQECVPRYHGDGIANVLLTQWAANSAWLSPALPAKECRYNVSFVGQAHSNRSRRMDELRRLGIEVECFGNGWPNGPVAAEQIPLIMRNSVISLNFSDTFKPGAPQVKARTFEVPGAGGFLLTEYAPGLERVYHLDKEIVVFKNTSELAGKIRHYLTHLSERDAIAQAGHERTRREHTYEQRMREVLDFASAAKDRWLKANPKQVAPDMKTVCHRHRLTPALRALRALMIAGGTAIWGRERGIRAARRLAYELSWRLAGETTYSASGWPGRMFSV